MVKLHVKQGETSLFLYETKCSVSVQELLKEIIELHNLRLKVDRLCDEVINMADHGVALPPHMQGLTDEQVEELKLVDEWGIRCQPSGGVRNNKDPVGRRNGQAPNEKMQDVLKRTAEESRQMVSKKLIDAGTCLTLPMVQTALDQLRGATMIVYPMGLPPHEPVDMELKGEEDLSGTQASKLVIALDQGALWFSGKQMDTKKELADYIGRNEKTKIICKLQKQGHGAPAREPIFTEDEQKKMMASAYKRQEELKKLESADDDSHLHSKWADNHGLQRSFQGLTDIGWKPK
ncbi:hypothetical protein LOD99_13151 [Oopsacas minuta]|uniref:Cilia- and flagella-associated protein 298 n=1 Tax=Oopsacas minuta TaxID=111878 RepID=A0AAV7JB25_9METZ|nr:hypothetical protein LOD99_13151 [Oopsacas minuta]